MTEKERIDDTKSRIIKVASDLFAKNGFSGASVREIARIAEVNLSAINYHFGSKEGLYWKVYEENKNWITGKIEEISSNCSSTSELAIKVFRFFISSESAVMNSFKFCISDNVNLPEGGLDILSSQEFGPPGQAAFLEFIQKDLGKDIPKSVRYWAVKMIFSQLAHISVLMNTTMIRERMKTDPLLSVDSVEKHIHHAVNAHLEYAKNHHADFDI